MRILNLNLNKSGDINSTGIMSSTTTISQPRAVLICRPNSHPFQDRTVGLDQSIKIGRSVARSRPALANAIFDCKVLSRNHALLWYETGKFYLQDTKSSNGTFINNQRLSKSSEESPPREVSSGDIVQFGVDVMEVTKKVTHGCIVATLQLFLPDGKEAKASSSTMLADKASTTSVQEIYQLNQFIQEALNREQLIETKLSNMNKLMVSTKDGVETNWKALIEEDRLLTRVDILERQLEVSHKSMSEDKLRNEVIQLYEDKEKYQAVAKEILRKAVQEKMDSRVKFQDLEMCITNSQQEKVLLKDLCESSAVELSDLAVKYEESQRKSKELVQELSQTAEKYKEEVEALNKKLKDGESLVAERQKVIDALVATVDAQMSEKIREALARSSGPESGDSGESVIFNKEIHDEIVPCCEELNLEYQKREKRKSFMLQIEVLKDELNVILREKLEIHKRLCQLIDLFENLKSVSNKVEVCGYVVDLMAKIDGEICQFKNLTQIKDVELERIGVYDIQNEKLEKVEDVEMSSPVSRIISIYPKTTPSGGEMHANLDAYRWLVYDVDYMECKLDILRELLDESRHAVNSLEFQNGAVNVEIQHLTAKLSESTKQLDYYKVQVTAMSEVNQELERRLALSEQETHSVEQRLSNSVVEMTTKDKKSAASDQIIQQLMGEVSALTQLVKDQAAHPSSQSPSLQAPQQSPQDDLRKDRATLLDGTTQTLEDSLIMNSQLPASSQSTSASTEFLSSKLLEAEEELAIYKEQYRQSSSECLRLERKLTEQTVLAKESNFGALRYLVPLMILILAILIAFHPSS